MRSLSKREVKRLCWRQDATREAHIFGLLRTAFNAGDVDGHNADGKHLREIASESEAGKVKRPHSFWRFPEKSAAPTLAFWR